MALSDFTFHRPDSLAAACALGEQFDSSCAYLAGGTELLVDLRSGRKEVEHVISLASLKDLRTIRREEDRLEIGSLVTLNEIGESPDVRDFFPALGGAALTMAGRQIRNLATIGGNFCCGVPCADMPPLCIAADAVLHLAGTAGERTVAASEFCTGPRQTVLKPGEILRHVSIPASPSNAGFSYQRFGLRRGMALAVGAVAARVDIAGGRITAARVVLSSVGPRHLVAGDAGRKLIGKAPTPGLFAEAGRIAAGEARPITDLRGSEQYRRDLVEVLTCRALTEAAGRAGGGGA